MTITRRTCLAGIVGVVASYEGAFAATPSRATLWLNVFIPKNVTGLTKPAGGAFGGQTMIPGPLPLSSTCYLTDNRDFSTSINASSRMHSQCVIDLLGRKIIDQAHRCDPTIEIDGASFQSTCQNSASTANMSFTDRASEDGILRLGYSGAASNGCFHGAPDIDVIGTIEINTHDRTLSFSGKIEPFPAFEMYMVLDGGAPRSVFTRSPKVGSSPWNLVGGPSEQIDARVTF